MELFGVQELPNAKSISAPGWAYVPDTGINPSVAALQPTRAKRVGRPQANGSAHEHTAKQDAKILRELAALDRDGPTKEQIPIPAKHKDNAGKAGHKTTPAVRKILQSQKTFANHLSDAEALAALSSSQPQPAAVNVAPPTPAAKATSSSAPTPAPTPPNIVKRAYRKKGTITEPVSTPLRQVSTADRLPQVASGSLPKGLKTEASSTDVLMTDAPLPPQTQLLIPLPPSYEVTAHPGDHDALLRSHIPSVPSDAELLRLIAAPPLTYQEARGEFTEKDLRKPVRAFCEKCGYWGRVKCMKCGARVCALECLKAHRSECVTRYGA